MKYFLLITFLVLGSFKLSAKDVYNISKVTLLATRSYWHSSDLEKTKELFNRALKEDNLAEHEISYIYLFLGKISLDNGDISTANEYFNKSMKLYSNPYPLLIKYYYYHKNSDKLQTKYFLNESILWYEKRVTLLLSNSFDFANLQFWNTRSPIDGAKEQYQKYPTIYDTSLPIKDRWLACLQFYLEELNHLKQLGEENGYITQSNKNNTFVNIPFELKSTDKIVFSNSKIEELPIHKINIWYQFFTSIKWTGDINCELKIYEVNEELLFNLLYQIKQQENGIQKLETSLSLNGKIAKDSSCLFQGFDGKYYPFCLMEKNDNIISINFPYKILVPIFASKYHKEQHFSKLIYFNISKIKQEKNTYRAVE